MATLALQQVVCSGIKLSRAQIVSFLGNFPIRASLIPFLFALLPLWMRVFRFPPFGGACHESAEGTVVFASFHRRDTCAIDIVSACVRKSTAFERIWMILNVCYRLKGCGARPPCSERESACGYACMCTRLFADLEKSYMFACSRLDMLETKKSQEGTEQIFWDKEAFSSLAKCQQAFQKELKKSSSDDGPPGHPVFRSKRPSGQLVLLGTICSALVAFTVNAPCNEAVNDFCAKGSLRIT